jgi:hypothetical protein
VGPAPTLPPNQQPPSTSRDRQSRTLSSDPPMDLAMGFGVDPATGVVSQPVPAEDLEPGAIDRHLHELADTQRTPHPPQEPEPLGRRVPPSLDAGREGVER